MGWLNRILDSVFGAGSTTSSKMPSPRAADDEEERNPDGTARNAAYNRLKLVLMHDRTQISPAVLEKMRDDMMEVISRYLIIDRSDLDLRLENDPESNTIALVANIPVLRSRGGTPASVTTQEPAPANS
jgi:cell division topological specificity factor